MCACLYMYMYIYSVDMFGGEGHEVDNEVNMVSCHHPHKHKQGFNVKAAFFFKELLSPQLLKQSLAKALDGASHPKVCVVTSTWRHDHRFWGGLLHHRIASCKRLQCLKTRNGCIHGTHTQPSLSWRGARETRGTRTGSTAAGRAPW